MKKLIITILLAIFTFSSNAQKKVKKTENYDLGMGFEKTKKMFKANFDVLKELTLKDKSKIAMGDTVRLGKSTNKISSKYQSIFVGRITTGGALMGAIPTPASDLWNNDKFIVERIKISRSMGKVGAMFYLRESEIKGVFGNVYLTASDMSVELGELINPRTPMTRKEAIEKLKEAKDLMDIEMMSKEEFEELKKKLAPIIRGN